MPVIIEEKPIIKSSTIISPSKYIKQNLNEEVANIIDKETWDSLECVKCEIECCVELGGNCYCYVENKSIVDGFLAVINYSKGYFKDKGEYLAALAIYNYVNKTWKLDKEF